MFIRHQELFRALSQLADGCIRVVDNSEVIITYSSGAYSQHEHHGLLPSSISEQGRLSSSKSHKHKHASFRAAGIAVLVALRFKRIMSYLRRLDPSEVSVFDTVGDVRFNLTSLPNVLENWYPPTESELAHSMPSKGALLILGAAYDALQTRSRTRTDDSRYNNVISSLSLLDFLLQKPVKFTSSVKQSSILSATTSTTATNEAPSRLSKHEYFPSFDTLQKTLTSMSAAIRDMREREINYKVPFDYTITLLYYCTIVVK